MVYGWKDKIMIDKLMALMHALSTMTEIALLCIALESALRFIFDGQGAICLTFVIPRRPTVVCCLPC
jgi:hypothetical protein